MRGTYRRKRSVVQFRAPGFSCKHAHMKRGENMKTKKRTICRRFESLQQARDYANTVNAILKRRAAYACEISKLEFTPDGPQMRVQYYEVCFDTYSPRAF